MSLPARSRHRSNDRNEEARANEKDRHDQIDAILCLHHGLKLSRDEIVAAPGVRGGTVSKIGKCCVRHFGTCSHGAQSLTALLPVTRAHASIRTRPVSGADGVLPRWTAGNSRRLAGFFRISFMTDERGMGRVGKAGWRIHAASQTASGTDGGCRMPHSRPSAGWAPGSSKWP